MKIVESEIDQKVFRHSFFEKSIYRQFESIEEQRRKRPNCKPGFRYKKDWVDRMQNDGVFNAETFLQNAKAVLTKTSDLPAILREPIFLVCQRAFIETLVVLNQEKQLDPA